MLFIVSFNIVIVTSRRLLLLLFFLITSLEVLAQNAPDSSKAEKVAEVIKRIPMMGKNFYTYNYKRFSQFYERENPVVGWKSKMYDKEAMLFDFQPILTLGIFNNFDKRLNRDKGLGMSYYFAFRPHFRMYNKNSTPVSTPSYRIFIGVRHMYRLNQKHYIGVGLESGHYSNGQPDCALMGGGDDGSAACDSLYALLTKESNLSEMINRRNGDYSTNLSQLTVNYRYVPHFDRYNQPQQVHSLSVGIERYHDFFFGIIDVGGFGANAIKTYGKWRFLTTYTYSYQWLSGYRVSLDEDIEIIQGAHPWVNPFRSKTTATIYFPRHLGFYMQYIYGHDDYNLRFVDSGHQCGVGFTWDMFAPIEIVE